VELAVAKPAATDWRVMTRRLAIAAALLLPLAGEAALRFSEPRRLALAGLGYFLSCLLFAVLAPRLAPAPDVVGTATTFRRLPVLLALPVTAVGIYLAMPNPRQWILVPIWLLGMALWLLGWAELRRPRWPGWRVALPPLAIVALAAVLRLWDLGNFQPLQVDELTELENTIRHAAERPWIPNSLRLFGAAKNADQMLFPEYLHGYLFQIAGLNMVTLRLFRTLMGIAEVALVYLIGREMFDRRVGLVAAALLTPVAAHLSLSRSGLMNIEAVLVFTGAMYFLARGLARRSPGQLALSGFVLSGCIFVYFAARPGVAVVLAVLALAALDPRLRGRWLLWGTLALVAGFLVGGGPMIAAYIKDPIGVFAHKNEVTGWLTNAIAAYRATGDPAKLMIIWERFYISLLGFNIAPSVDNHYRGRAVFNWLPAALLFAGVVLSIVRLLDWRMRLLALWFWGTTISLSMLSDVTPAGHRVLPAFAPAVLLAAVAFDRLLAAWESLGRPVRRAAYAVAAVLIAGSMVHEAAYYFGDFGRRDLDWYGDKLVRYVLAQPQGAHIVLVPGPSPVGMQLHSKGNLFQWASDIERRVTGDDLGHPVDQLPELAERPAGVTYLVHGQLTYWLDIVRSVYPNGRETRLVSADPQLEDRLAWVAYEVAPEDVAKQRGLTLRATDAAGVTRELTAPALVVEPGTLPADLRYPVALEWRGWVRPKRSEPEPYRLASTGTVAPTLRVGDATLDLAAARELRPWRSAAPLVATATLASPSDTVQVTWDGLRRGEQRPMPLGQAAIWPGQPRVQMDWLTADGGRLVSRDYDAVIADTRIAFRRPGPGNFLLRWQGALQIEAAGVYEFEVLSDGPVRLQVDGRPVWPPTGDRPLRPDGPLESRRAKVSLAPGARPLQLDRVWTEGGQVVLLWRRGDGEQRIVPPEAFAPLPWPR
jgi:hypothetical protein